MVKMVRNYKRNYKLWLEIIRYFAASNLTEENEVIETPENAMSLRNSDDDNAAVQSIIRSYRLKFNYNYQLSKFLI